VSRANRQRYDDRQIRILRRPGLGIAVALLIVAGVLAAERARGPVVATTVAARTDLEQHLIASGRVRVVTRIQLSSQISGRAVAVRVAEGQRVRTGDLLVQLDDAEARAAVSQAKAAVSQASGRVEQLRKVGAIVTTEASLQTATNLARAEAELARAETLAASGAVARVDLDERAGMLRSRRRRGTPPRRSGRPQLPEAWTRVSR